MKHKLSKEVQKKAHSIPNSPFNMRIHSSSKNYSAPFNFQLLTMKWQNPQMLKFGCEFFAILMELPSKCLLTLNPSFWISFIERILFIKLECRMNINSSESLKLNSLTRNNSVFSSFWQNAVHLINVKWMWVVRFRGFWIRVNGSSYLYSFSFHYI